MRRRSKASAITFSTMKGMVRSCRKLLEGPMAIDDCRGRFADRQRARRGARIMSARDYSSSCSLSFTISGSRGPNCHSSIPRIRPGDPRRRCNRPSNGGSDADYTACGRHRSDTHAIHAANPGILSHGPQSPARCAQWCGLAAIQQGQGPVARSEQRHDL